MDRVIINQNEFRTFIPVLMKMKKWKTLFIAVMVVSALSAPYFILVPNSFSAFAKNVTESLSVETLAGNQGLVGLLGVSIFRLGDRWIPYLEQFVQNIERLNEIIKMPLLIWAILVVCCSLFVTLRASITYSLHLLLSWIMTYFMIYKHVLEHQYVMLLPVFVILLVFQHELQELAISNLTFWISFTLIALPTPFIFIDKPHVILEPEFYWTTTVSILFHFGKPVAVMLLYVGFVRRLLKREIS